MDLDQVCNSYCTRCGDNQELNEWNREYVICCLLFKYKSFLCSRVILSHRCIKKLFNFIFVSFNLTHLRRLFYHNSLYGSVSKIRMSF